MAWYDDPVAFVGDMMSQEAIAGELFDLINSYSFDQIEEAVVLMFSKDTDILVNSWQSPVEFHLVYYPFWRLASRTTKQEFTRILLKGSSMDGLLRLNERSIAVACNLDIKEQPPLLLRFLVSLEEIRNFEIELIEKGIAPCYPEKEQEEGLWSFGLRKSA